MYALRATHLVQVRSTSKHTASHTHIKRNRYQLFEKSAASIGGFSQWCSSCNKTTDPHAVYNAWLPDGTPVFGQPAALWCVCARARACVCFDLFLHRARDSRWLTTVDHIVTGIHRRRGSVTEQTVAMGFDRQPRASGRRLTALRGICAPSRRTILRGRCLSQLMALTIVRAPRCRQRVCVCVCVCGLPLCILVCTLYIPLIRSLQTSIWRSR